MKNSTLFLFAKYAPDANKADSSAAYGYGSAQTTVQVLKQAGDNWTRENLMKETANLKQFNLDALLQRDGQYQRDGFLSDRAIADAAIQAREVGAIRSHCPDRQRLTAILAAQQQVEDRQNCQ
jgi:hypothetical protein